MGAPGRSRPSSRRTGVSRTAPSIMIGERGGGLIAGVAAGAIREGVLQMRRADVAGAGRATPDPEFRP